MSVSANAVYLGDGAYVLIHSPYEIEIFTHNGVEKTNSIFLEHYMVNELKAICERRLVR